MTDARTISGEDPRLALERLARLERALVARYPLAADDALAIGVALSRYLTGEVLTLEEAMGLALQPGTHDPRGSLRREERNQLIVMALASGAFPSPESLAEALEAYAGNAWPRERELETCPERRVGSREAWLWAILKAGGRTLCARTIREIARRQSAP